MVSLSLTRDLPLTSALLEKQDYAADLRATFGAGVSFILQPAGVQIETSGGMVQHDTTSLGINLAVSVNRADAAGMAAAMSRFDAIATLGTPAFRTWLQQAELLPKFAMAALGVTNDAVFEGMMKVRATGERAGVFVVGCSGRGSKSVVSSYTSQCVANLTGVG